jgi:hypothetical protein
VAEDIAGAVDAGAFAVPHAEHAIIFAFAAQLGLLGAPERGGRKVFVDAGLESDMRGVEEFMRTFELLVEAAERRAAIAGDEAGRAQAGAAVALVLHQAKADQRLKAGDEDPALRQIVFIVECDVP